MSSFYFAESIGTTDRLITIEKEVVGMKEQIGNIQTDLRGLKETQHSMQKDLSLVLDQMEKINIQKHKEIKSMMQTQMA